jgi:hypothetical protein
MVLSRDIIVLSLSTVSLSQLDPSRRHVFHVVEPPPPLVWRAALRKTMAHDEGLQRSRGCAMVDWDVIFPVAVSANAVLLASAHRVWRENEAKPVLAFGEPVCVYECRPNQHVIFHIEVAYSQAAPDGYVPFDHTIEEGLTSCFYPTKRRRRVIRCVEQERIGEPFGAYDVWICPDLSQCRVVLLEYRPDCTSDLDPILKARQIKVGYPIRLVSHVAVVHSYSFSHLYQRPAMLTLGFHDVKEASWSDVR